MCPVRHYVLMLTPIALSMTVWSRWAPPRPTKVQVFRHLEPEFRAAISKEIDEGVDPPTYPAARIVVAILRRVAESPRHHQYALRVRSSDPT
jgi:hypothetical protein